MPENLSDVEDLVLFMRVWGDAMALELLSLAKDGKTCVPPLMRLCLGPATSVESSEIENVSLLCQRIERHAVLPQSK